MLPKVHKKVVKVILERGEALSIVPLSYVGWGKSEHIAVVEFTYDIHNGLKVEVHNPIG